ncbi:MAG: coiled-coil domain-containing protein [Actinobacteria bacterium]|nr:coiled-coil domain-containing protein [Actinomycetota bacterium]
MVRRINLVPQAERRRTQTDIGLVVAIVIGVVIVGAILFSYFQTHGQLSDRQAQLAQVQTQIAQVQAQLGTLAQYEQLQNEVTQTETVAQQIYAGRTLFSEVLGDISLVIPENVWIADLNLNAPVAGTAKTGGAAAAAGAQGSLSIGSANTYTFEDVARAIVRLQQVPSLSGVTLTQTNSVVVNTVKVKTFGVTATLVNTQPTDTPLPISQVGVQ